MSHERALKLSPSYLTNLVRLRTSPAVLRVGMSATEVMIVVLLFRQIYSIKFHMHPQDLTKLVSFCEDTMNDLKAWLPLIYALSGRGVYA
eukprot:GILJ01010430.1.p1 GENE.GILJ01010430.1~~GILJ01010430.1.p1  ORF type:complete len:104 (+),score=3.72 GILJ01010430.1:43-312(+)